MPEMRPEAGHIQAAQMREATVFISRANLRKLWTAAELLELSCPEDVLDRFIEEGLARIPDLETVLNAEKEALSQARMKRKTATATP